MPVLRVRKNFWVWRLDRGVVFLYSGRSKKKKKLEMRWSTKSMNFVPSIPCLAWLHRTPRLTGNEIAQLFIKNKMYVLADLASSFLPFLLFRPKEHTSSYETTQRKHNLKDQIWKPFAAHTNISEYPLPWGNKINWGLSESYRGSFISLSIPRLIQST